MYVLYNETIIQRKYYNNINSSIFDWWFLLIITLSFVTEISHVRNPVTLMVYKSMSDGPSGSLLIQMAMWSITVRWKMWRHNELIWCPDICSWSPHLLMFSAQRYTGHNEHNDAHILGQTLGRWRIWFQVVSFDCPLLVWDQSVWHCYDKHL